ncbi:MAG TPA: hypothetical protein VJZ32_06790 [Candidatus Bathyarchaeia archaeon]|nr:hypothetical protein [Candidatus Bathyarchaeia archaeon]
MEPYLWVCVNCGWRTEQSTESCPKCQNRIWSKIVRVEKPESAQSSASNQHKKIESTKIEEVVKNYLKQITDLFNSVECGKCHTIIYTPIAKFDRQAFENSLRIHYSKSPECIPESQTD